MSAPDSVRVAVVGATGYTGAELLRLLTGHPHVRVSCVTSRTRCGESVSDLFPGLRGHMDDVLEAPDAARLSRCDLVFFATPNATAMRLVPALLDAGTRVVDLSADFRLRDARQWEAWYGCKHACPDLLAEAVYGLPELHRSAIRTARLVANPGCYPTAVQIGFIPLLENRVVDASRLIADAKSGASGAGRQAALATQLCEASENIFAYAVSGHRHLPEIVQGLESVCDDVLGLVFVPHLVPMIRGIHATLYATLHDTSVDIQALYEERYGAEPFVDVLAPGAHPETRNVRGANVCQLAWHRPADGDTLVVLVVEDNLVKGAAGQAVQNMNIMLGYDERAGLMQPAMVP